MLREDFEQHQEVVAASTAVVVPVLEEATRLTVARLLTGSKVLVFGNGGSASQADHFAAEITGRYRLDRAAWPAISLASDAVVLTAVANDYGFERAFARQVEALARRGDVVVAISTSGTSPNVVAAAEVARDLGCHVVALTGEGGGDLAPIAELLVAVPSKVVARIQEVHEICLHAWAGAIEAALADTPSEGS